MFRQTLRAAISAWSLLTLGTGVAIAAARLAGASPSVDPVSLAGFLAAAGLAWGLGTAWWGRWSTLRAAMEIDRTLALKDRLSAAIELASSRDAFATLLLREAERLAADVQPHDIVRVRDAVNIAGIVRLTLALAACVGVIAWMPTLRWNHQPAARQQPTAETLAQAREIIREAAIIGAQPESSATGEPDTTVAELEHELREGRLDDAALRARAASIAQQTAQRLESQAEQTRRRIDAMRSMLARAAAEASPQDRQSELARALQRADTEAAAKAARELGERLPRLTPEERLALEQELAAIEEQLAAQTTEGENEPPENGSSATPLTPAARPDADTLEEQTAPSANTTPPEKKGEPAHPDKQPASNPAPDRPNGQSPPPPVSEQTPIRKDHEPQVPETHPQEERRPADRAPERERQTNEHKPPADKGSSDSLRKALREAREQLRDGEKSRKPDRQSGDGIRSEQMPRESGSEQRQQPPDAQDEHQSRKGVEPGGQTQDQARPTPGGRSEAQPTEQEQPETKDGATESQRHPEAKSRPGEERLPRPGSAPEKARPRDGEDPKTSPQGLERLAEELQRIARDEQAAKELMREAGRFRDQAQRMLEQMTPRQRREMERLAREFAKQMEDQGRSPEMDENMRQLAEQMSREAGDHGGSDAEDTPREPGAPVREPGGVMRPEITRRDRQAGRGSGTPDEERTTRIAPRERPLTDDAFPADARAPGVDERPIAELASPVQGDPNAQRGSLAPVLREAAQSAERSIEQRAVPAQYADLVRRVFKRYVERGTQ
jgi:hypothetical protein